MTEKDLKDLNLNELIEMARAEREKTTITVIMDNEHLAILKLIAKWRNETISDTLDEVLFNALQ